MNYINILNKIIDENKKNEKTEENPYFVFTWGQAGAGKQI